MTTNLVIRKPTDSITVHQQKRREDTSLYSGSTARVTLGGDDEVLDFFPDKISAVLPHVDGNAPGPEEPESEDDSPDDSDADADFEGLE
ncbi:hypothetical protein ACOMHN_041816 [Nucella lapillus]